MLNQIIEKSYKGSNVVILLLALGVFVLFLFMVLLAYPDRIPLLLWFVPFFTFSKRLVIGASFAALALLIMACGIRWANK